MNRLLFCIILLLTGHSALAEKLYRWVEPDGSITFSPTPPPAGIDYKAVNAAHNNAAKAGLPAPQADLTQPETGSLTTKTDITTTEADLPIPESDVTEPKASVTVAGQKPSILATSEHGLEASQPSTNAARILAQPAPAEEQQKLTYAPEIGSKNETPQATTASEQNLSAPSTPQIDSAVNSKKRRQCQDLNKRIMSLERRLSSQLEPLDMDNTVIAMARYQRSYNQHCVE